jgi:hypothetical protein
MGMWAVLQLTILATDDNPGLQLYLNGEWQGVPPMKDAFIINLGDLLERCDLFKLKEKKEGGGLHPCKLPYCHRYLCLNHTTPVNKTQALLDTGLLGKLKWKYISMAPLFCRGKNKCIQLTVDLGSQMIGLSASVHQF